MRMVSELYLSQTIDSMPVRLAAIFRGEDVSTPAVAHKIKAAMRAQAFADASIGKPVHSSFITAISPEALALYKKEYEASLKGNPA